MAKKKPTAVLFNATIMGVMSREVTGTVVAVDEAGLVVKYKKPRSSKYLQERFSLDQVLAIYGALEVDADVTVSLKPAHGEYDSRANVTAEDLGNGFLQLTDEDGEILIVRQDSVTLVGDAEAEEAAPAKAKAKAKGKPDPEDDDEEEEPAPKAKKKAKPEPEDDDEEEEPAPKAKKKAKPEPEDDDDEEDEPAPKKGAKPAKGKAKAKAEEDDSDDWED